MKLHWEETNGFQLLVVVVVHGMYIVNMHTMFDTYLTSSVCKQICMLVLTTCLDMCFAYTIYLYFAVPCAAGHLFIY